MKTILRFILTPVLLVVRLALGTAAFAVSISSSLMSLLISLFAVLAVAEFLIGFWQNGIALLILAILVSPVGLSLIANCVLNSLSSICSFLEETLY